jgi:hypothetical protein
MPVGRKEAEPAARPARSGRRSRPSSSTATATQPSIREAELVPDEIHQLRGILAIVDRESGIEADLVGMFTSSRADAVKGTRPA